MEQLPPTTILTETEVKKYFKERKLFHELLVYLTIEALFINNIILGKFNIDPNDVKYESIITKLKIYKEVKMYITELNGLELNNMTLQQVKTIEDNIHDINKHYINLFKPMGKLYRKKKNYIEETKNMLKSL